MPVVSSRRGAAALALSVLLSFALPACAADATPPEPAPPVAQALDGARVIVKFKALGALMRASRERGERGPRHAAALGARHSLSLRDGRVIDARSQVVWGSRALTSAALAERLAQDAEVEYAVPDLRRRALALPNDPLLADQWYLKAPDSTFVSAINAVGAWALTTGSARIVVADADTGVLFNHPDLAGKLLPGYDFVTRTTTAKDGDGRDADAADPGDFTTANQCASGAPAEPSAWHGTKVASLIGAQTNNGAGMASVGYDVKVLPVRVLGTCGGDDSDIIAGMLWAAGVSSVPVANPNPAQVINLSLGSSSTCGAAYQDAVNQIVAAGVTVVAAVGNDSGRAPVAPASCKGVIAVAGVTHAGLKADYANIGPESALAAPGGDCANTRGNCVYPIVGATNTGTTTANAAGYTYSNSSSRTVGTSFGAPMVSGAAALMLSVSPALTPAQIRSLLMSSARSFPAQPSGSATPICRAPTSVAQGECYCTTSTCGAGLLDVRAAVAAAAATAAPTAGIAASNTTVLAGATVSLDGGASVAPGVRTIVGWQWAVTAGSSVASFTGATNAATSTLKTTGVGTVTVQLTVTDSTGQQATRTQAITVNLPAAPTVALLASASAVAAGTAVSFDGGGSQAAAGLGIAAYQWSVAPATGSPANLASFTSSTNASTAAVATLGSGSGSFVVTLTVTDPVGQSSSASTSVVVTPLGPTASLGPSATSVPAGGSLTFDSSASSAPTGRTLASRQWSLTAGNTIASITGSTTGTTLTVSASAVGSFTVQLVLTDSAGAQATLTQTITVSAAAPTGGSGGSSGGGGASSLLWLLALALASMLLQRGQR